MWFDLIFSCLFMQIGLQGNSHWSSSLNKTGRFIIYLDETCFYSALIAGHALSLLSCTWLVTTLKFDLGSITWRCDILSDITQRYFCPCKIMGDANMNLSDSLELEVTSEWPTLLRNHWISFWEIGPYPAWKLDVRQSLDEWFCSELWL